MLTECCTLRPVCFFSTLQWYEEPYTERPDFRWQKLASDELG